MVLRRVAEAMTAMNGELAAGDAEVRWSAAVLDSRRVGGGELFFALPGEASDGHRFVAQALARGAAAAVVSQAVEAPPGATLVRVADTYAGLHALTRSVRESVPKQLVGITGSVGKTTTKELLAGMLGRRFRVAKSPGNLNNLYGFPLALLGAPDDTEWMVAELGMSTPGELREISRLARPDVAVFTSIQPVHLEFFGSIEAIAEAKAELLEGLAPDGLIVANVDDPQVERIVRRYAATQPVRVVWFGSGAGAEVTAARLETMAEGAGSSFELRFGDLRQPIELPLLGRHNVENFLAAAACALTLGVSGEDIAAAAALAQPAAGRGVVHRLRRGVTLVDDSYNSNPTAVRRALAAAALIPAKRHWAVLGDMLELGETAPALHRESGAEAARLGFSPVFGVGALARNLVEGAGAEGEWCENAAVAAERAIGELQEGDLVLVKGSRGVGLEVVVQALRNAVAGRGGPR